MDWEKDIRKAKLEIVITDWDNDHRMVISKGPLFANLSPSKMPFGYKLRYEAERKFVVVLDEDMCIIEFGPILEKSTGQEDYWHSAAHMVCEEARGVGYQSSRVAGGGFPSL